MKWRWIFILLIPAVLAVLGALTGVAVFVPIHFTVTAPGRILPQAYVQVTAARNGRITQLHPAGPVRKGEILFRQSTSREQRELSALRRQLELLEKQLAEETEQHTRAQKAAEIAVRTVQLAREQARADLESAEKKLHPMEREIEKRRMERRKEQAKLAHKEYQILQTLAKQQSVPRQEVVRGETADTVARLQLEEEQWSDKKNAATRADTLRELRAAIEKQELELERRKLLAAVSRSSLFDAQRQVETVRAQIAQIQADIDAKCVAAPSDGEWISRQVTAGEFAPAGKLVGVFMDDRRFRFVGTVREAQAPWVRPGTAARIRLTAFPYLKYGRLRAEVTHIEPVLAAQPGMPRGYRVELLLTPGRQPYTPLPGLTGRADIQVFRGTLVQYLLANPEQVRKRRHGRKRRPGLFDLLRGGSGA